MQTLEIPPPQCISYSMHSCGTLIPHQYTHTWVCTMLLFYIPCCAHCRLLPPIHTTHTHTCMHARMHARTHTHTHAHIHIHAHANTHMHAHTHTHACTHTYIHTHTSMYNTIPVVHTPFLNTHTHAHSHLRQMSMSNTPLFLQ